MHKKFQALETAWNISFNLEWIYRKNASTYSVIALFSTR
jgi:hypothetical protein